MFENDPFHPSVCSNMPNKRRRKGDPRNEAEDFQLMDVDFNPPPSAPIATSSSTVFNVSQWDISGNQIHGKTAPTSMEGPTAETTPSATDSTTQTTFDPFNHNVDVESTFHDVDENISHVPSAKSAKRSFLAVSHFLLTITISVLNQLIIS